MTRSHILIGAGCLSVFSLGAGLTLAQQGSSPENGGPVLTFGLSSTLSATDNYNLDPNNSESAELFDNRLSFGYLNQRANDVFRFDVSGLLRANEPPGDSRTFDDQRARLGYDRQGVNSALSFGADYSLASINSLDPFDQNRFFDDPLEENDLAEDQGDRQQISSRFRFEAGLDNPVGFILDGRYREQTYNDTTDPDLFDSELFNLTGTTRFTLSPVTEVRTILRYDDYTADDTEQTNRQTSSFNLGLTQALSPIDTLDVVVGFQSIETEETILGIRDADTQTGVIGSIDLTRELTRGTIGTSFDLRESVNGQTATWLVNRDLPLPRGSIELSLGATSDVDDTVRPVGSLDFTHEMKRSTLTASLSRQVTTSSRSNELRTTEASLGYNYEINSLSEISFSANYAELKQAGGPAVNDTTRTDLRATYSRNLTPDWRLSSGYEYRLRDETGVGDASSNRVFLTLEREFTVRP
ncbi:MAG: hypothetical protein VR71_05480 [Roseovarius sp. BRH_c41]|uniref:hypothetical protein n=1 Tax=Roseovarius sp. BRH_c41 TaxID=1629709 RepID=UPI0005F1F9BA|nr:hypothetical protein [Roseovarius sp. BRH_c41]KJS44657.1 MAG: hypothetical protein VR71_05480 [Roseovarius sp. BRH_c41]